MKFRRDKKWEDKTSPNAGRKAERQAGRLKDKQAERQTERTFVGLSILSDSISGVDPLSFKLPDAPENRNRKKGAERARGEWR